MTVTVKSRLFVWPWHRAIDEGKKKGAEIVFLARCSSRLNEKTPVSELIILLDTLPGTFIAFMEIFSTQHILRISDKLIFA
jgi:hypothetical protein